MAQITPKLAPPLSIPSSPSVATLQALGTTVQLYIKSTNLLHPTIPGHETCNGPNLAFHITHPFTSRKILFDAGIRKDYWNYSPLITTRFATSMNVRGLRVDKGVDEVLTKAGVKVREGK
jgi:hypothetical protein